MNKKRKTLWREWEEKVQNFETEIVGAWPRRHANGPRVPLLLSSPCGRPSPENADPTEKNRIPSHISLLPLLHCLGLFLSFFRSVYLFLFLNKNRNKTKKTKLFLGVWQGKGTNSKPDSGGGGGGLSFRTIRPGRMWNGFFIRAPSSKTLATK